MKLIAGLSRLLFGQQAEQSYVADLEGMNRAMAAALERFPNDAIVQDAKANSELMMRSLQGKRIHDA